MKVMTLKEAMDKKNNSMYKKNEEINEALKLPSSFEKKIIETLSNTVIDMYGLNKKFHKDAVKFAKENAQNIVDKFLSQENLSWEDWWNENFEYWTEMY